MNIIEQHRYTYALAFLLSGGNAAKTEQEYEPIADAIEETLRGYPDEQKAELYAFLAESIVPQMPWSSLVCAVNGALVKARV